MNVFKRTVRLSARIASIEAGFDAKVETLGKWLDERAEHNEELRVHRDAVKAIKAAKHQVRVLKKMIELGCNPIEMGAEIFEAEEEATA